MGKTIWLDHDGWPVEQIEGRPFTNWLRNLIHGRKRVNRAQWEYQLGKLR